MNSAQISLCMIVRDEARTLPACLDAAKAAVDEIVIVDTGSRDDTIAIAKDRGARVVETSWEDDFAKARNLSLAQASGDWILVLDADETLTLESPAILRRTVENRGLAGAHLRLFDLTEQGKKKDSIAVLRLFRNDPAIRFRGRIHEQIGESLLSYSIRHGLTVGECEAAILHTGYQSAIVERQGKRERNARIFRLQIEEDPTNAYAWFKYAGFLGPHDPEGSKRAMRTSLDLLDAMPPETARAQIYGSQVAAHCAFALLQQGQPAQAKALLERAAGKYKPMPNFVFAVGCIALKTGDFALARDSFRACLGFEGKIFPVSVEPGITGPIAHFGMGEAYRGLGLTREAEVEYRLALKQLPGYPQAQAALDRLLKSESRR